MYRVCGLRLAPKFKVRPGPEKNLYLRLAVENVCLRFLLRNISGFTAEMAQILRLRLSIQIK